jgi:transposase InsO family protein
VVIDDASRYAVVVPVADESGASAAHALEVAATEFAKLGIRIERVLTDNGWAYTRAADYRAVLDRLGARHKRTRPWRPQTNGKAERFIQTLINEWAYARPYQSNEERSSALPGLSTSAIEPDPTPHLAGDHPSTLSTTSVDHS